LGEPRRGARDLHLGRYSVSLAPPLWQSHRIGRARDDSLQRTPADCRIGRQSTWASGARFNSSRYCLHCGMNRSMYCLNPIRC